MEPFEEVMCEVNEDHAGPVIDALTRRLAELTNMVPAAGGRQRLSFVCPSRGMIGFKTAFAQLTRGEGLLNRAFLRYACDANGGHQGSNDSHVSPGLLDVMLLAVCLFMVFDIIPRVPLHCKAAGLVAKQPFVLLACAPQV